MGASIKRIRFLLNTYFWFLGQIFVFIPYNVTIYYLNLILYYLVSTRRSSNDGEDPENSTNNKTKGAKRKPTKSPQKSDNPKFSSKFKGSLEKELDEALLEEIDFQKDSEELEAPKTREKKKREICGGGGRKGGRNNRSKSSPNTSEVGGDDDIGFSFFNKGDIHSTSSVQKQQPKTNTNRASGSKETKSIVETPTGSTDLLGFSFLPVREKKNGKKTIRTTVENEKKFKPKEQQEEDQSRPQINQQGPLTASDFVLVSKLPDTVENGDKKQIVSDDYVKIVNKESGKVVFLQVKESKKVHSKVSYASVAQQSFEETLKKVEKKEQETHYQQKQQLELQQHLYHQKHKVERLQEDSIISSSNVDTINDSVLIEVKKKKGELSENKNESNNEGNNKKYQQQNIENKNFDKSEELEELKKLAQSPVEEPEVEHSENSDINREDEKNLELNQIGKSQGESFETNIQSRNSLIIIQSEKFTQSSIDLEEDTFITSKTQKTIELEENLNLAQPVTSSLSASSESIEVLTASNDSRISIETTSSDSIIVLNSYEYEEDLKEDGTQIIEPSKPVSANTTSTTLKQNEFNRTGIDPKKISNEVLQNQNEMNRFAKTMNVEKIRAPLIEKSTKPPPQIRVLTINDGEHSNSTLFRVERNWCLNFRLGPSLFGRTVALYCNYPQQNHDKQDKIIYERTKYEKIEFKSHDSSADDTATYAELCVTHPGSFHYYFVYVEDGTKKRGSGYFIVDPVLKYGLNEELLLDCIQCQTVLAKNLGNFRTWERKLRVSKESGYNMIHFTPIQKLGVSNSCYSLSDQLEVNPDFETCFDAVGTLLYTLRTKWRVTSICDIVLNHTANESAWLKEHPDASYNLANCPYLRPAYLLDAALQRLADGIVNGFYESNGIPAIISTEDHLNALKHYLHTDFLRSLALDEFYVCDINELVAEFLHTCRGGVQPNINRYNDDLLSDGGDDKSELVLEVSEDSGKNWRRFGRTVNMRTALRLYNVYYQDCFDEEARIKRCGEVFKGRLDELCARARDTVHGHLCAAIDNLIASVRYFRVQSDGPKLREVTESNPLFSRYFTDGFLGDANISLDDNYEILSYGEENKYIMAHNGWVMNADPLKNFASKDSQVYLRRELIAWGDSVKLRYGEKPEDSPFLWKHMKKYVEQTAKIFDGVRLDNCHSTPLVVAEYMLDSARKINPNLYVVAELFTNSDQTDNIFVNRLGITSLIREAMSAWNSHELGRLVYRYGGVPVGAFHQPHIRPLVPTIAHALFLDQTHDNPSPVLKRSVFDLLPSTTLVNMACCASGSTRGYDELVPQQIDVVQECREYTEWRLESNLECSIGGGSVLGSTYGGGSAIKTLNKNGNGGFGCDVHLTSGIVALKRALNELHYELGVGGFNQVYVDQIDGDLVAVTRHCPRTHCSYVAVAFTAFRHPVDAEAHGQRIIKPLRVEGKLEEIVLEATLKHVSEKERYARPRNFSKSSTHINGYDEYRCVVQRHVKDFYKSSVFDVVVQDEGGVVELKFKDFKPGSVVIIKVSLAKEMDIAVKSLRQMVSKFSTDKTTELGRIISEMSLADLNRALYRCDQEERDEGFGFDTYDVPDFGKLVYAGLQGIMSLMADIRPNNDLGHPLCKNIRDGDWLLDYTWKRLKLDEGTEQLGVWLESKTSILKKLPRYLVPCYFDQIITGLYVCLLEQCYNLMSDFVKNGSTFVKALALGSVQMSAYIPSSDLPTLSPHLALPKAPFRIVSTTNPNPSAIKKQACVSLSAGLPHFSVGYMRNWGRDTFIALRGLMILTGRHQEARQHILAYAACLRHGLIPNLLDGGRNARYNCRDAIWWWLYCVRSYTEDTPDGFTILWDKVARIYPKEDEDDPNLCGPKPADGAHDQVLADVIQEALTRHFQGLLFRERNAGPQIDSQMLNEGFNNQIGVHPDTGFVFGGNPWNCGTWMDKMGSSELAGNRGKPATARDGSAIELVGLQKACVTWLARAYSLKLYPYEGVERVHKNTKIKWTYKEWADRLSHNFEKHFWIEIAPYKDEINSNLINKRGIYKDCVGSSEPWTDYQLRCNFPIAMVVAPELFDPVHAWTALEKAEKYLLGPLGMRTLDPDDWQYRGDYDNSNSSSDRSVANGFNYHQGPEWVWPVGFFLRAKLVFAERVGRLEECIASTKVILSRHFVELQTSVWRGLPELTNSNGSYCRDSSKTQAWSMSCILEVLHDLQILEKQYQTSK